MSANDAACPTPSASYNVQAAAVAAIGEEEGERMSTRTDRVEWIDARLKGCWPASLSEAAGCSSCLSAPYPAAAPPPLLTCACVKWIEWIAPGA